MAYICTIPTADMSADYVDDGHGGYKGECVSLLKRMCSSIPATARWRKGVAVKDNATIIPGTAIASFDPKTSQYWHAAIYVSQDATGISEWDQYCRGATAHPPEPNVLRWKNDDHPRVAGDSFYVID